MSIVHTPKRMRFILDSEECTTLFQKRNDRFKRAILKSLISFTEHKDALRYLTIEYKKFERSDNTIEEIRCCDRVIATIYLSRTDFNHQEALWSYFPDVFPFIKKHITELKKRL